MRTRRRRLLPDRTAKLEAACYVLGPGLALVGLVITLVFAPREGLGSTPPPALVARSIAVVAGLAVAGLALARRARPDRETAVVLVGGGLGAATAALTAAIDPPSVSGSSLALAVLFAVAVRRARPRVAVVAGLLALVTYVVSVIARAGSLPALLDALDGGAAAPRSSISDAWGWGAALLVGLLLRSGDGTRRVEALARVRASERLVVARELHDLVARHVTGMVVRTQALGVVAPDLPAPARAALDDIETAGNDALAAMRRMVGVLREVPDGAEPGVGPRLDDLPSAAVDVESAIRGALDEVGVEGATVHVDVDPSVAAGPAPPRDLLTTVHRLVSEGLTNAARHAPAASRVEVTAVREDGDLVVTVANDGVGSAPRRGLARGGFGLVGAAERVRALGGTLDAGPDGPGRWVVHARIPTERAP